MPRIQLIRAFALVFLAAARVTAAHADTSDQLLPPTLEQVEGLHGEDGDAPSSIMAVRRDAQREAALSLGARAGLAFRTWEIRKHLARSEHSLAQTFDFRRLLIAAPSGLLIEPPVVSEGQSALIIKEGGQSAAVADRILMIQQQAKIVSAPRDWRFYLERDWGVVKPPPALLLPKTDEEEASWRKMVAEGWKAGLQQADEIFQTDLDRMTRDFAGMVRYRELLARNMISAPYALLEDRGVTGGGSTMRVGDRAVRITGPAKLDAKAERWIALPQ